MERFFQQMKVYELVEKSYQNIEVSNKKRHFLSTMSSAD